MRSPEALAWSLGLAIFLQGCAPASGQGVPPVDGDPILLLAIRDAQQANVERYPFGEIEAIAEIGTVGKPAQRRVEALVRWDGDFQRLTGTFADLNRDPGGGESKYFKQSFELIYRGDRSVMYVPEGRLMTIWNTSKGAPISLTRLRPQDWWYGKLNGEEPHWAERLDLMLRLPPESLRYIRVRRLDEDRVEVSRDAGADARVPGSFRNVFSLEDEGNLVSRDLTDPRHGFKENRKYVWGLDSKHRYYLKSCRIERHTHDTQRRLDSHDYWTYEVTRFDSDARPPKPIFEDGAIKLATGTLVDDNTTGKRRRIGDWPAEDIGAILDRLVPELKSRGFASDAQSR